ncbi:hypothetical protein Aau02nite_56870 [Amorphoplanes auranticolor]|uniref:Orc1-like AAA ATPase domain-containing protein n=2 Tax=Actinoplanes auranticolor TaxID=47988 RepID=A0A919SKX8_9ACTN|nr:hypothetical protein Aau02nite_56870 [Actinoplanes auranticolor]
MRKIVGREPEIATLNSHIAEPARAGYIFVLSGVAGVGKTALATDWAHRISDRFPDGQIYLDLKGFGEDVQPLDPSGALGRLLRLLRIPAEHIPADKDERASLYRRVLAERRILVVLDNAHDAAQIRPLLPGAPASVTIITGRDPLHSLVIHDGAVPVILDVLDESDSLELLYSRIGRVAEDFESADAVDLVRHTGGLPLALAIVAARIQSHTGASITELAGEVRRERSGLDLLDLGEAETSFRAVVSPSYRALSGETARLFRLFGVSSCFDLSWQTAANLLGTDKSGSHAALQELGRHSLVQERAPGRFRSHDLVRAYAAELASAGQSHQDDDSMRRLRDYYLRSGLLADHKLNPPRKQISPAGPQAASWISQPADYGAAREWFEAEHDNIVAILNQCQVFGLHDMVWQLAWTLVTFYDRQGRWHEQVDTQRLALASAEALGSIEARAVVHRLLGQAYGWLGRHPEAVDHCEKALTLYQSLNDLNGCARTHYTLGWAFGERRNDYSTALIHAQCALEIYTALGDSAWQARTLNSVGWYQAQLSMYREALLTCDKAIDVFRRLPDPDRHGEADTLDSLGYVYHQLGDHDRARQLYEDALHLWRLQGNSYYEADTLHHLGDTLLAGEDHRRASESWRRALDILERIGHPESGMLREKLRSVS